FLKEENERLQSMIKFQQEQLSDKDIKIQELHAANVELRLEIDDLQLKNLKII
ncbi:11798_t:CDS:1, partial [Funneliformis caledonium]